MKILIFLLILLCIKCHALTPNERHVITNNNFLAEGIRLNFIRVSDGIKVDFLLQKKKIYPFCMVGVTLYDKKNNNDQLLVSILVSYCFAKQNIYGNFIIGESFLDSNRFSVAITLFQENGMESDIDVQTFWRAQNLRGEIELISSNYLINDYTSQLDYSDKKVIHANTDGTGDNFKICFSPQHRPRITFHFDLPLKCDIYSQVENYGVEIRDNNRALILFANCCHEISDGDAIRGWGIVNKSLYFNKQIDILLKLSCRSKVVFFDIRSFFQNQTKYPQNFGH